MNNFKEFDNIKTPHQWIQNTLDKPKLNKKNLIYYRMSLVCLIVFIFISSFGIVYACNQDFREWIMNEFPSVNQDNFGTIQKKEKLNWIIENQFLYYYNEETMQVKEVQKFENGKFIKVESNHIQTEYNHQTIVFDYVIHNQYILTYNHQGLISYSLPTLNDKTMYFCSTDMNIYSYDFDTNKIEQLTKDNCSQNPHISPKGTYMIIRKGVEYWTVYNLKTKDERKIDDLSWASHYGNEYVFLDDSHILTYDSTVQQNSCIIDLETLTTEFLDGQGWYPQTSILELQVNNGQQTIIKNLLSQKERILQYDLVNSNTTYIIDNRYIFFQIINNDIKNQYIYDFDEDQLSEINLPELEYIECFMIDSEYMIFYDSEEYIAVSIKELMK